MGQNRYRLFKKNECMKIEQDIETLNNPIFPEQLFAFSLYRDIYFPKHDLIKYVDFGLNLN